MMIIHTGSFQDLASQFRNNFNKFIKGVNYLFKVNVTKDELWQTYLNSFPEENGVRQGFNCNSCRQFIKNYGGIVKIQNNTLYSIWRFETDPLYQKAMNNLADLVESSIVNDIFLSKDIKLGHEFNYDISNGSSFKWYHFSCNLPTRLKYGGRESISSQQSLYRSNTQVFKRALDTLSKDSILTALELIASNSLESGAQFKNTLEKFLSLHNKYHKLSEEKKNNFCWIESRNNNSIARIYNSAIGTLLKDLNSDLSIEAAVIKFGKVMNPYNYKRPKAIITQRTIANAEKQIQELGLENSLGRRLAVTSDISINNMLWVNRLTQTLENNTSIFDTLREELPENPKKYSKVKTVPIAKFLNKILPTAKKIELLLENKHTNNLVSLIAPNNLDTPPITKWDNGFTWVYTGGLADSIKNKVKAQGGTIDGYLRCSLQWYNYDDLDLHIFEPQNSHVYYSHKTSNITNARLDVDENAGSGKTRDAVENIIYPYNHNMIEGTYTLKVHNYSLRERIDFGFTVEVEFGGEINTLTYDKLVNDGEYITVATFNYNKDRGIINFKPRINCDNSIKSKEVWGLNTNKFHDVTAIMKSPNHWDTSIGNEHLLFMLEGAENKDPLIRGFFNEQLRQDLLEHKRVFETLGSKLRVSPAPSSKQLSGLGFPTTKSNSFILKVTGTIEKVFKVTI